MSSYCNGWWICSEQSRTDLNVCDSADQAQYNLALKAQNSNGPRSGQVDIARVREGPGASLKVQEVRPLSHMPVVEAYKARVHNRLDKG